MEKDGRSLEEMLKDAHKALRAARADVSRAISQRDQAYTQLAMRRVKADQLEAWTATLQAKWDAVQPGSNDAMSELNIAREEARAELRDRNG